MTERLIAKLDRLGAEAGIKEMTPEVYRFAQILNDDKLKQWDEWKAKREWVALTAEKVLQCWERAYEPGNDGLINAIRMADEVEQALKEKNT